MEPGQHQTPVENPAETSSPAPAEPSETASPRHDDELSGQADLDARLAEPILKGTAGIEHAQVWITAFLIVALALIAYSNAFTLPFHHPDKQAILFNPMAHSPVTAPLAAKSTNIPILSAITIGLNWWFSPGIAAMFHATNIILHALAAVMVYLLARRLVRAARPEPDNASESAAAPQLSEMVAMVAGALVALHPLATESVNLIVGRTYLLLTIFAVSSVVLFLRGAEEEGGLGVGALIGSGICFGLAWACSVAALAVPALVLAADWIVNGTALRRRLPVHAALWGVALAMAVWGWTVARLDTNPFAVLQPQPPVLQATKAAAFSRGIELLLSPVELTIEHDLPPASGILPMEEAAESTFLATTTAAAMVLIALVLIAVRSPAGLALAWIACAIAPVALFVPPHTAFTERSLYFGIAGLALLAPWVLAKSMAWRATAIAAAAAAAIVLLAAASGTFLRNSVWRDEFSLWTDAQTKSPDSPEPFIRLGQLHHDAGQSAYAEGQELARQGERAAAAAKRETAQLELGLAENFLTKAVELKPNDARLRNTLGVTLAIMGKRDDAIAMLTEALRLDPSLQDCTIQLATLYETNPEDPINVEGRQRALDYFRRAERLGPLDAGARITYAMTLARVGNLVDAARVLATLNPQNESSPAHTAMQQLTPSLEQLREAQRKLSELEQSRPGSPETALAQVEFALAGGKTLEAFYLLDRYLKLHPENLQAWLLMGVTRARVGEAEAFTREYPSPPPSAPNEELPWMQLAKRAAEVGRWDATRTYLEFAASQNEAYAKPLVRVGQLALDMKQPTIAAGVLDEAAKANPQDPSPWLLLCDVALLNNNKAQAAAYLDEAERLGASPADVAPRREKAGETPEDQKRRTRTILQ